MTRESDDHIRSLVEGMRAEQQEAVEQARKQEAANQAFAAQWQEKQAINEATVIDLCEKFAPWASRHGVSYDIHSLFGSGWLLGTRKVDVQYYSIQGIEGESFKTASLLVTPRIGDIREVVRVRSGGNKVRYKVQRNRPPIAKYSAESVSQPIADIAFEYNLSW